MGRPKDEILSDKRQAISRLIELQEQMLHVLDDELESVNQNGDPPSNVSRDLQRGPVTSVVKAIVNNMPEGITADELIARAQGLIETGSKDIPTLIRSTVQRLVTEEKIHAEKRGKGKPTRYYPILRDRIVRQK